MAGCRNQRASPPPPLAMIVAFALLAAGVGVAFEVMVAGLRQWPREAGSAAIVAGKEASWAATWLAVVAIALVSNVGVASLNLLNQKFT